MKKIEPSTITVEDGGQDLSVKVKVESKADVADVVDALISLDDWEFKQAIKCAKHFRRANDVLQNIVDKLSNEYAEAAYVK